MELADVAARGWGKPEVLAQDYDDFAAMFEAVARSTGAALPNIEHTAFQVRFMFWGCWYALELGEWDEHVSSMRAAGWVH